MALTEPDPVDRLAASADGVKPLAPAALCVASPRRQWEWNNPRAANPYVKLWAGGATAACNAAAVDTSAG